MALDNLSCVGKPLISFSGESFHLSWCHPLPIIHSPSSIDFDFRTACAIIRECDLFIGPEGGFGHVAAALGKKAILYFGGWIHPKVTGYDIHENIYFDHPKSPCGSVGYICEHCEEARRTINADYVYKKVISALSI